MSVLSNMQAVAAALTAAGFVPDGATPTEHVRIPTVKNPVYGGLGGKPATFGGRARYSHPSGVKATVGKVTTCVYLVIPKEARRPQDLSATKTLWVGDTRELEAIRAALARWVAP